MRSTVIKWMARALVVADPTPMDIKRIDVIVPHIRLGKYSRESLAGAPIITQPVAPVIMV